MICTKRRPLLDIGHPQGSPQLPALICPHPAISCDLQQVIRPSFSKLRDAPRSGTPSSLFSTRASN